MGLGSGFLSTAEKRMNRNLKSIEKEYDKCFVLTDHKFTRIIQIAKERMEKVREGYQLIEEYNICLADGKELTIDNTVDVLTLDNSKKNPIKKLTCHLSTSDNDNITHQIVIQFDASKRRYRDPIYIAISSLDFSWAQEAIGALEEQVERAIPNEFSYSVNNKADSIALLFFMMAIIMLGTIISPKNGQSNNKLFTEETTQHMIRIGSEAQTDSQKIDFLYNYAIRSLKEPKSSSLDSILKSKRTYFIGAPSIFCFAMIIYAIFWCYPRNVFAWGDNGETYTKIVERRKLIWSGIILAFVIGVLGNLFMLGALS